MAGRKSSALLMLLYLCAQVLWGRQFATVAVAAADSQQPAPLNAVAVAAFVDEFMQRTMAEQHVPGAAIVVVQNDQLLFGQGYGMADLAKQLPVDLNKTLFRAGSVSKLFTATAVMQLVEQGKIDLNGDVNDYLQSYQVDARFDRPVTVADLLQHTAGFDDVFFGMHVRNRAELEPLADFIRHHMPARYTPPGAIISYNDHGYTLAGLLVQDVSGLPFDEYVATNILHPLQMENSTFAQPQPAALQARMALGYRYHGADFAAYPLDYVNVAPAAALVAPAAEMAHFISAQLNGGQYDGVAILEPATVAAMQQIQFAHHPALRGRGYGFAEWRENGRRAAFHDGGNPGFLNRLFLLPEEGVGFYLTFNLDQYSGGSRFHRTFTTEFLDAFFPEESGDARAGNQLVAEHVNVDIGRSVTPALDRSPAAFVGYYREAQAYSHDTFQKLASLPNQVAVRAQGDKLQLFGRTYETLEPLLFVSQDGESTIAFREEGGTITYLFAGAGAFVKVPWYEAQSWQMGFVVWFVVALIAALIGALVWRRAPWLLRVALALVGLLNLAFLGGMAVALLQMDPWQFAYGPPLAVRLLLFVPLLTLALTFVIAWSAVDGWRRGRWGWIGRGYVVLVTATLLSFPVFLNIWNLFGLHY